MGINIVLCAMEEGKQYLPEDVPCLLSASTKSTYLRELWRGGIVERKQVELDKPEPGKRKKRIVYVSKQKRLDL